MKRFVFVLPLVFLLFIFACGGTGPAVREDPVDTETNYFYPRHQNPIAIFPAYKFLGKKHIQGLKATRDIHIWKESRTNKYIIITVLLPTQSSSFPQGINWVDKESAIYARGNIAAYNSLHIRPRSVVYELDGFLPDCVIVASEFYLDSGRREALYKTLVVPDKMCAEVAEPVIEELNRVANMQ